MYTDESMYHHVPTNTAWKRTFTSIYINLHESGIARYSQTFSSRPEIVFNIYLQDSAVPESWLGGGTGLCWYMPWYTMYVAPWLKQNETEYLVHPYELYNIITIQKLDTPAEWQLGLGSPQESVPFRVPKFYFGATWHVYLVYLVYLQMMKDLDWQEIDWTPNFRSMK